MAQWRVPATNVARAHISVACEQALRGTPAAEREKEGELATTVVYHLPQIPGNSSWDVVVNVFLGSSHWKIPGTNGNSEKVVPFSRLGRSEWKFVYRLQVS